MGNVYALPQHAPSDQNDAKVEILTNEKQPHNEEEYDVFKDSWLRYLGYTNEVGEAFRRNVSRQVVYASYAIATGYVVSDVIHKSHRSIQKGESTTQTLTTGGDTFVWQMLASVIIPGYVINRITYFTRRLVRLKRKKCICTASPLVRYTPILVGLISIPFVIHPIDTGVTWLMDNTARKFYKHPDKDKTDPKNGK